MIIKPMFEGDDDLEVMLRQQKVYATAVDRIVGMCRQHVASAVAILDMQGDFDWKPIDTIDREALEEAHDILAAAWRAENDLRQGELPLPEINLAPPLIPELMTDAPYYEGLWLEWLYVEVRSWWENPGLVRGVFAPMLGEYQSRRMGCMHLALDLIYKFEDVRWYREVTRSLENSLGRM